VTGYFGTDYDDDGNPFDPAAPLTSLEKAAAAGPADRARLTVSGVPAVCLRAGAAEKRVPAWFLAFRAGLHESSLRTAFTPDSDHRNHLSRTAVLLR
jgi:hypothetical protein